MNPFAAKQVALDNDLVPLEKRLKIKKCNARTELLNQDFVEPPSEDELVPFIQKLDYSDKCDMLSAIHTDQMHKPWRTFVVIINRCVSGKTTWLDRLKESRAQILWGMYNKKNVDFVALLWEDFMFEADNKEISSARTLKFISKTQEYQHYGALIPYEMIKQDIKDFKSYKTYPDFATRKATTKKARKFKKVVSPSRKLSPILEEEPTEKPKRAKKPAKKSTTVPTISVVISDTLSESMPKKKTPTKVDRGKGMDLLSNVALLKVAQLKKNLKKSKLETYKLHASGSGDGVGSQPKVLDEQEDKTTSTDEGTSTKPGVGIKSHLNAVGISDAHIDVNTALIELVLLMNFKDNILSSYYCEHGRDRFKMANSHVDYEGQKVLEENWKKANSLVSCDGLGGYNWSDQVEEGPNYALMAYTSSTYDSKIDDNYKKGLGYESYNVVPTPYTGNFMPPKPDLSYTSLDEFTVKPVAENKFIEEDTKAVRKNTDTPIIKEWVSDDEEENDKGVIDSGCSRYNTGNMSYLTDYEEIDRGYVAFRGNPKGGKITRKDTKDETIGILKSFITRIENLIDPKVKVIRYDNKTVFKNREMNQFCEIKGILRQFSVTKTSQQHGVAEMRNRKLIEDNRIMLVDSKLPTTFWAEAVNTACYVQNRVLVVKPHNKTPYELFMLEHQL
uniref:Putative ribonuclease H-like domain-containing protein n=1 Tax=Tanacetum cinerariifolium TaxID=118510 RepID=A0A699HIP8_TANCI|nr:putative ribonuclease H-like domain-containing protein [Tanacetum cinerariifolium]